MNNYIIPTTIVDGFFNDPQSVRDFALQQEFFLDPNRVWPGKRTKYLHEINPELFNYVHNKILSLFYRRGEFHYVAASAFQIVDNSYDEGWIHSDNDLFTAIIYLNENPNKNSGTTIYIPKKEEYNFINSEKKEAFFANKIDSDEVYRKENNERFEETIVVKNKFNRLLAFDSCLAHGGNDFKQDEPRLTLVTFVQKLDVDVYPIQNMRKAKSS